MLQYSRQHVAQFKIGMSISQHIAGIRSRAGTQIKSSLNDQREEPMKVDSKTSVNTPDGDDRDLSRKMDAVKISDSHVDTRPARPFVSIKEISLAESFGDRSQDATIERLEQKWSELNTNLEETLKHLQNSSHQVTESSLACLESLKGSVETTCDKIDGELKAFFHLMTKCDELTTKLSIANSFRDEIKTLRKSVETLEQLHRK